MVTTWISILVRLLKYILIYGHLIFIYIYIMIIIILANIELSQQKRDRTVQEPMEGIQKRTPNGPIMERNIFTCNT